MTLKTGDVLKDNDPRTNGATVEVIAVGDTHAICKRGPRRVEIAHAYLQRREVEAYRVYGDAFDA